MRVLYAIPAYSSRKLSEEELTQYWESGRDFKIVGGPYFSIRDKEKLKEMGYTHVELNVQATDLDTHITIDLAK